MHGNDFINQIYKVIRKNKILLVYFARVLKTEMKRRKQN